MVTREQIEAALLSDDGKAPFQTKNIDYKVKAIILLRVRIPYEVCKSIIGGAGHDVLYLCDVNKAITHLTEEDLVALADCNCWIDKDVERIALFV